MSHRVAIIEFINESNTFTVMRTKIENFQSLHYFKGEDIASNFRDTGTEIGGAIKVAQACDWTPVYITAAHAEPGGPVTEATRAEITNECISRLCKNGPFDGVFVALHGAMVTETDEDGDCQFLREVRAVVGAEIPLAVTLDLHANIFDELATQAQIAVSFRTYPHVDMRERGIEACELLHQAMEREITPRLVIKRPPMLATVCTQLFSLCQSRHFAFVSGSDSFSCKRICLGAQTWISRYRISEIIDWMRPRPSFMTVLLGLGPGVFRFVALVEAVLERFGLAGFCETGR